MPRAKITFAAVRVGSLFAHRGEVVDIEDKDEYKRLEAMGAIVGPDEDLQRPGQLVALLDNANEEHILAYLASGGVSEIVAQAENYPSPLVERILIAERSGQQRQPLIGGLEARLGTDQIIVPSPAFDANAALDNTTVEANAPANTTGQVTANTQTSTTVVDFDAAQVLEGNVGEVLAYAEDNPEHAAALLDAEQAEGAKQRSGVIEGLTKLTES